VSKDGDGDKLTFVEIPTEFSINNTNSSLELQAHLQELKKKKYENQMM
jgi:hypothetical protein